MLGYVVTVIVTISLALGNTLPLCLVVSPASRPRSCVHPHTDRALPPPLPRSPALPPARNVRNENECISDSDKYPNDPTASHGSARPLRARNEQVIAMGRTFIIMPACLSPMCIRRSLVCLCRVCPRSRAAGSRAASALNITALYFVSTRKDLCLRIPRRFWCVSVFANWKAMIDDVALFLSLSLFRPREQPILIASNPVKF